MMHQWFEMSAQVNAYKFFGDSPQINQALFIIWVRFTCKVLCKVNEQSQLVAGTCIQYNVISAQEVPGTLAIHDARTCHARLGLPVEDAFCLQCCKI